MNTVTAQQDIAVAAHCGRRPILLAAALAWLCAFAPLSMAQETQPPAQAESSTTTPETEDPDTQVEAQTSPSASDEPDDDFEESHVKGHNVILRFEDSNVGANQVVDAVISIGGSSTTAGKVREAVVSVFGNTHVTGPVGDSAVAVFGSTYVNSRVHGDVVAVFGDVELGPQAQVGGEVVVVSGKLIQDPAATVRGDIQQVTLPTDFGRFEWLRPWIKHCLLYGRPLAIEPGLGWAWSLAIGFLTLYVLLALLFSSAVEKCVATVEARPGRTLLAAFLTLLLTPILTVLLAVTIIGVPFFWLGLFIAGLFGKTVILAALGRRLTRFIGESSPLHDYAFAVLVGGVIVLGMYTIPVVGFVTSKVISTLGLGVIVYTLLLAAQERRENAASAAAAAIPTPIASEPATEPAAPAPAVETPGAAPASASSPVTDSALPRAGFWIRMLALLIDMILIGVAFSVLNDDDVFLPALAAYGAIMWKLKGTTVGGIVCNLKVVRVDGRAVDWPTAAVRALSCFLSLAVAGLGFVWIAIDKDRQAWHDKIAGTAVVRVPRGVSLV